MVGLRKRRRQHGWQCSGFFFFSFLDNLMSSLADRRETGMFSGKRTTSLSGTLVSLTQPGVHISLAMS